MPEGFLSLIVTYASALVETDHRASMAAAKKSANNRQSVDHDQRFSRAAFYGRTPRGIARGKRLSQD
jgi:hypothetical protein